MCNGLMWCSRECQLFKWGWAILPAGNYAVPVTTSRLDGCHLVFPGSATALCFLNGGVAKWMCLKGRSYVHHHRWCAAMLLETNIHYIYIHIWDYIKGDTCRRALGSVFVFYTRLSKEAGEIEHTHRHTHTQRCMWGHRLSQIHTQTHTHTQNYA